MQCLYSSFKVIIYKVCMVRQKRETSNRNVNKKYKKHKCNVTHIILPPVSPPDFHPVFQPPTPPLFTYSGFLCSRKVKISRLCVPRFHFCFCNLFLLDSSVTRCFSANLPNEVRILPK